MPKKISALVLLLVFCTPAFAFEKLPFIEDNYAQALTEAKARKLPLFVEVWAPW